MGDNTQIEITDEMIEKSKREKNWKGFTIIDDNYILIQDSESLKESIAKTKRLREKGVNYCGPVSFKNVDEQWYFLEHRAKGKVLSYSGEKLKTDDENSINDSYMQGFEKYMQTLNLLKNATQEQYLKFFDDIEEMRKENLKPDICSLDNLLYDENEGFNFIDAYGGNEKMKVKDIFRIILNKRFSATPGYGATLSVLPSEYKLTYNEAISEIISKILLGLKKYNYPEEEIKEFLDNNEYVFSTEEIVEKEDISKIYEEKIKRDGEKFILEL